MAHARDVVIVDGLRTPFAKSGGKLAKVHPAEIGRSALKELIARTNLDVNLVDEVIIGNTGNPADAAASGRSRKRQPWSCPCCGSMSRQPGIGGRY